MADAKTKTRIATQKVVLYRDGKRFSVKANEKFPFTAEEIESIRKQTPNALRAPVNEDEDLPTAQVPQEAGKQAANAKTGGKAASDNGAAKNGSKAGDEEL